MKLDMKLLKSFFFTTLLSVGVLCPASAADFIIDTKGGHAAINFKFKHLGISWLTGGFNSFEGTFSYSEEDIEAASISVDIDITSLDSNHPQRDSNILGTRFLDVENFPYAKFVSTSVEDKGHGNMTVRGNLSLNGITKEIAIEASKVGGGDDPWGGFRVGFEGITTLDMRQFGYDSFGPTHTVDLLLYIEGVDQAKAQR